MSWPGAVGAANASEIRWPDGKRFAFTVFEDPDASPLSASREVYSLLSDLGFRTTVGVWTVDPGAERRNSRGETCENPEFLAWMQELQRRGFEIGLHSVAPGSLSREEIVEGLARFRAHFGGDPVTMANHYNADAMYWGPARLNGLSRAIYNIATRGKQVGRFNGEREGHPSFWGDLCRSRVRYCRNFVFRELNTLKACPMMPYHDPDRPYVNQWYAAAEASNRPSFLKRVTESTIDRLEEEGGAAIIYTHFGHGFFDNGSLDTRFKAIMTRLAQKNGWFVPVKTLLGFLEMQGRGRTISRAERNRMAWRWLWAKLRYGTS
jgi:peptidoglycan/xylan/chitin deacetylase (PgdA/CDA1 family)